MIDQSTTTAPLQPADGRSRVALVTGAGSGIGLDVALHLARTGYTVAVNDLDDSRVEQTVSTIRAAGGTASGHVCDVVLEAGVEAMVDDIVAAHGELTVLVACAGISDSVTPTVEQSADAWQRTIDVDLRGVFLCCKFAGRVMRDARRGSIVAIASIAGLGGFPARSGYGPAKAAVINLTELLAVEMAPYGVRVNSIAPGYIKTEMVQKLIDAGRLDESFVAARCPTGRFGTPAEVTHAVDYLIADRAGYTTGSTLVVDGGWSAWLGGQLERPSGLTAPA